MVAAGKYQVKEKLATVGICVKVLLVQGYQEIAQIQQLKGYSIVWIALLLFIILTTFTSDYQIRLKAKTEMETAKNFARLSLAWIPETVFRIAAVYWKTNGLAYEGRHRLEDKWKKDSL